MKVLIGTDTYYPEANGTSYFAQRLAGGLKARGHDVHVVSPSRALTSTRTEREQVVIHGVPSLPVVVNPPSRFAVPFVAYRKVLSLLETIQPDVIHVQGHLFLGRAVIRAACDKDIPIVATNHFMPDNLVVHLPLSAQVSKSVCDWLWADFARVFNQVTTITTPTPTASRLIRSRGISREVLPVSCGVDCTVFKPTLPAAGFRERYGITDRPSYLYVGRLDKEKRIHELIEALPLVLHRVDAQLVIAGMGKERQALEALSGRLGVAERVVFTGFVPDDDLPSLYAACNVFCNASTVELQSIVTMEAMATGLPVIAVDAVALPHLVHHQVNGYTYQPGDLQALAGHLVELLSDPDRWADMSRRSLEIIAFHDLERTVSTYEDLYGMVLNPALQPYAVRPQVADTERAQV